MEEPPKKNINRQRGNNFERYFCKRAEELGFINPERQPLSGQLFQAKYKSDATMSALMPDQRLLEILISCKCTIKKDHLTFCVEWLEENERFASNVNKIPILSFKMGGKPGQKLTVYVVISHEDFIKITGNDRSIVIVPMKFRGKKQMSFTKKKLDACRYKNGQPNKIPVSSFIGNEKLYYVFRLEEFHKAIMVTYEKEKTKKGWF